MANTITDLMPKVLANGLLSLREMLIYPKLVNSDFSAKAAQKGDRIWIPTGSAVSGYNVSPAAVPPTAGDSTMDAVELALDTWKGANFHLTDKQIGEIDPADSFLPIQTSSAMRVIAGYVNTSLGLLHKDIYGYAGTAATTPFASDMTAATAVRKVLQKQLTPMDDGLISLVVNEDAYEKALNLAAFTSAVDAGSASVIRDAQIQRKLGLNWYTTTTVPSFTKGTGASYVVNGTHAAGATSLVIKTGTGTLVAGDVITIGSGGGSGTADAQTYVVVTGVGAAGTVVIAPGLAVGHVDSDVVTLKGTRVCNIAFHKEAFGLAVRPTAATDLQGQDRRVLTMQDDVSGIAVTLEVSRQYKQWSWEFSVLYGCKTIRAEYAAVLAG